MYLSPLRPQSMNSMPSLKVALVAFMNSCSSRPSIRLKTRMSGMVASPTPSVPISSDSSRVIETSFGSSMLDSAAAVIDPAEPPPAMTICFKRACMTSIPLLFEVTQQADHVVMVSRHGFHQVLDLAPHGVEHRTNLVFRRAVGDPVVASRPPAHAVVQDHPVFGSQRLEIERRQPSAALELGNLLNELLVRWFCARREPEVRSRFGRCFIQRAIENLRVSEVLGALPIVLAAFHCHVVREGYKGQQPVDLSLEEQHRRVAQRLENRGGVPDGDAVTHPGACAATQRDFAG